MWLTFSFLGIIGARGADPTESGISGSLVWWSVQYLYSVMFQVGGAFGAGNSVTVSGSVGARGRKVETGVPGRLENFLGNRWSFRFGVLWFTILSLLMPILHPLVL